MARGRSGGSGEVDWVARLADEVVAESQRRAPGRPVICASGISPSGPIHLGNLREIMVPHLVADEIRRHGVACEHILSWDDYDRFRKVPAAIEGIEEWNAHIGKPLTAVPPPPGSPHRSWAEHFRAAMEASLQELAVEYRPISQTQMYTSGAYRDQVLLAMRERHRIDEVLGRFRTKEAEAAAGDGDESDDDGGTGQGEYYPYRPYCQTCLRDTTRVIGYDESSTELSYECQCGHGGRLRLDTESHGKLVWKVDWPMRWAYEGVVFEPSGVDHQSPGSSFVVGGQLVGEVFGGQQPIGPMYAFVGISGMAKMSSSRGGVPTPADALAIMEPHLLRWLYARRRPSQSFTVAFDAEIHRLYDEWDALERKVTSAAAQPGDLAVHARSVRTATRQLPVTPRALPYRALASAVDITGGNEEQLLRVLSSMDQSAASPGSRDGAADGGRDGGAGGGLAVYRPRLDRAAAWVRTQLPPSERTVVRQQPDTPSLAALTPTQQAALELLVRHLEDDWSLAGLTTLVYGVPKVQAGLDIAEKQLPPAVKAAQRELFALLYQLLVGSDTGPRLPTLLLCIGPERTRRLLGH